MADHRLLTVPQKAGHTSLLVGIHLSCFSVSLISCRGLCFVDSTRGWQRSDPTV